MNCPTCAWPAQTGDEYCVSCGADLRPKGRPLPDPRWDAKKPIEALDHLPGHEHGKHRGVAPKAAES